MDTKEIAAHLQTTPRVLRQFLRSGHSTFVAVGSGARYEFTESDLPTLVKRFSEWQGSGKPQPSKKAQPVPVVQSAAAAKKQHETDREVWAEEGHVEIEDIRNPRVRARVKAAARDAEDRLMMLLMAKGLHLTQRGDSAVAA